MTVSNANGARHDVTRAEWNALHEQYKRVLADNAQVRGAALRARSETLERRLRSADDLDRRR